METILVTGGAGYVGSVLTESLVRAGYGVVVLDNLSTGHRAAVHPEAVFVPGDVRDRACLDRLFDAHPVDAAIHLAAKALTHESVHEPAAYYAVNLVGSLTLVDIMLAHGVRRLVFSSTAAIYGEPQQLPLDERHPTAPINAYGETKLSCERAFAWYARAHGLQVTSLRYFNAAGASETYGEAHTPETHLLPCILHAAATDGEVAIYGTDYNTPDGTCIRDFVHVVDLAEAHIRALTVDNSDGMRVLNLGSGVGYSVCEVLDVAEKVTGRSLRRCRLPRRAGDPSRLVASPDRAISQLGWQPRYQSLHVVLESAWRWLLAHPTGYAG